MTSVRLVILNALEPDGVTEEEEGGIEGPNVTPLFQGWAEAARYLPSGVGTVDLDLRHSFPLRFHVVGRLVQRMSTAIHVRSGRYTKFRISGCWTLSTQRYLEKSTVAVLVDREDGEPEPGSRKRKRDPDGDYLYLLGDRVKGRFGDVDEEPM
ncbi:hypothetical protein FQN54_008612 [Arachnomyces sp. PD_36]|nr:hypothetical protein FQN54_008612 [Arachnomyces sp. PD_36]